MLFYQASRLQYINKAQNSNITKVDFGIEVGLRKHHDTAWVVY